MSNHSSFYETESTSANDNFKRNKYIQPITSPFNLEPPASYSCNPLSDTNSTYKVDLKIDKKHKKIPKLIANISNTQYEVVRFVCREIIGLKLSRSIEDKDWDLKWIDGYVDPSMLASMKPYQKINHFPGMSELTRKNCLGKNLMRMYEVFPNEYNFFPQTWLLPAESANFRAQFKAGSYYIVKPEASCQGKGIYLVNHPDQIERGDRCVVQEYLTEPYLIDGLKFDMRIYALVYGCEPLRIFLYKHGLARFATDKFHCPSNKNAQNMYMHLTNYAINKNSSKFQFNEDSDDAYTGHKRCLQAIWDYIDSHNGNSKEVIERIKDIIIKTIISVQPTLVHIYKCCQPNDFDNSCCFEILGFDIILDKNLNPYVLEVNHSPSFTTDTPFDRKVKVDLIGDTLKMLHITSKKKKLYNEIKKAEVIQRQTARSLLSDITSKQRSARIAKRIAYEDNHLGQYDTIFPPKNCNKYQKYIEQAKYNILHGKSDMPLSRTKCRNSSASQLSTKSKGSYQARVISATSKIKEENKVEATHKIAPFNKINRPPGLETKEDNMITRRELLKSANSSKPNSCTNRMLYSIPLPRYNISFHLNKDMSSVAQSRPMFKFPMRRSPYSNETDAEFNSSKTVSRFERVESILRLHRI